MKILVINAGSSSLKYQLIDMANESVLAKGLVERIGIEGSNLVHKYGKEKYEVVKPLQNHVEAIELVLEALTDKQHGVISGMDEISAVGHRVVHGGEKFAGSVIITDEVMEALRENSNLAPLHNPANIMGIEACKKVMPNTPMVGVFDTAFHQTMPPKAFLYGLPLDYYKRLKIRKYGFHGTSHRYVSQRAIEMLGKPAEQTKIVTCHLGNGSSITAVDGGKSVDTTMGLTPLDGVLMGTRSGSIDPAIIEFIMKSEGKTIDEVMKVLNKESGLIGLSEKSSDMRDVRMTANQGDEKCETTLEVWAYGIRKYIGAFAAAMGGLDAIVFTAGIGENDWEARARVVKGLEFLGVKLDAEANKNVKDEGIVSTADSKVKIMVISTNEELAIARDTLALTSK